MFRMGKELVSAKEDSSSSSSVNGPLYELSELMIHLPIKRRGLSKHYQGKSQSFTSLESVKSLEDLAKENSYNKRMKLCRSYGGGLEDHHHVQRFCTPKPTIAKKSSSRTPLLATMVGTNNDLLSFIPIQK